MRVGGGEDAEIDVVDLLKKNMNFFYIYNGSTASLRRRIDDAAARDFRIGFRDFVE